MDLNDVQRLQDPAIQAALTAAAELSPDAFVLKYAGRTDWPVAAMAMQLQCRAKWRDKLPSWAAASALLCTAESYEQSSSEATAALKPQLLAQAGICCDRVLDLCAGLGVDVMAFAQAGAAIHYNDSDAVKAAIFQWNAARRGIRVARCSELTAEALIPSLADNAYDVIYADPSRRVAGERVMDLARYSPDLPRLMGDLATKAPYLLLKLAPQLAQQQIAELFPGLMQSWVVSVDRECKECLALVDLRSVDRTAEPRRTALCLSSQGSQQHIEAEPRYRAALVNQAERYLYDPDPAILVAGVSSGLSAYGNFSVLAQSHATMDSSNALLLTSEEYYPDFPGRIFKIVHQEPLQRKSVGRYLKAQGISRAHVWRCQSRQSVKELRAQFKLQDAAAPSCVALGLPDGQQLFMLLERVSPSTG